jgi:solute carrier family 25 oxoglutarate transporter 11
VISSGKAACSTSILGCRLVYSDRLCNNPSPVLGMGLAHFWPNYCMQLIKRVRGRYTTARMGFFGTFMNKFTAKAKSENRAVTFAERSGASLAAGGLGAVMGNPADLALIRMQSDGLRPVAERKNYTSVVNALSRIAKAEGVLALWNGCLPTVARAMALNFGQLAFYSETKARMNHFRLFEGYKGREAYRNVGASAIAGFFASFFSLPFDFIKTRLQKQTRQPDGRLPYRGTLHCAMSVAKEEGVLRFYRGFGT